MTSGFQSPNHTQVPNDLFEKYLSEMEKSELKVVLAVIRRTLGFHKRKARISMRAIEQMTGLAYESVFNGAEAAEARGLLERHQDGGVTEWEIIWNDPPHIGVEGDLTIRPETQAEDEGDLTIRSEVVQPLDQSGLTSRPPSNKESSKDNGKEKEKTAEEISYEAAGSIHKMGLLHQRLAENKHYLPWEVPEDVRGVLEEFSKVWVTVYEYNVPKKSRAKWIRLARILTDEFGTDCSEVVLEAGKLHFKEKLTLDSPASLNYKIRELYYAKTHNKPEKEKPWTGSRPG